MAKRFTDTDKWRKGLMRGLSGPHKLLWLYLCDECDHAGIWPVEMDVMQLRIGFEYDADEVLQAFAGKIIAFDDGKKWFIPSFVEFQYGELNPANNAHKSVILILERYGLNEVLRSPSRGAQDKDKDKDKDKTGGGCKGEPPPPPPPPDAPPPPPPTEEADEPTGIGRAVKAYADMVGRVYHRKPSNHNIAIGELSRLIAEGITVDRIVAMCGRDDVIGAHFRALDDPRWFVRDFSSLETKRDKGLAQGQVLNQPGRPCLLAEAAERSRRGEYP